ncbi:MAG: sterol desaturase family protein [Lewinella sp.]
MPEFSTEGFPLEYAIPGFVLLVALELGVAAYEGNERYERRDTVSSLSMGMGNALIRLVTKGLSLGVFFLIYEFRLFDLGDAWWVWVVCFFAEDLTYYVFHRSSHQVRYFWASHVIHHSSKKYNLSTALRQTWTGNLSGAFLFHAWLPLVGFHPIMVAIFETLSLIYQFWIHTEYIHRLPAPVEYVFNTPSHHRVHHARDVDYLDRNHGGVLIIWDRLFGTFQQEKEQPTYGLVTDIDTYNPLRIATHEWSALFQDLRTAPGWGARMKYLFGPPGWSHDGSRKTSRQLREESKQKRLASGKEGEPVL